MKGAQFNRNLVISLAALALSLTGSAAFAGNGDYFGTNTGAQRPAVSMPKTPTAAPAANTFGKSKVTLWYETMDNQVFKGLMTPMEKTILTSPTSDAASIDQWAKTAAKVAMKYRNLAKSLRSMTPPAEIAKDTQTSDLNAYLNSMAKWFDESASWFEDYIKPRQAATTIEELNAQLKVMHTRSELLKMSMAHLQEMDSSLRKHFDVHGPRFDDAIFSYASKKPQTH